MSNSIDFLIVNYNTFDFIKLLVKSIDTFVKVPFFIYIVDTSNQYDLFKEYYDGRKDIIIEQKKFSHNGNSNKAVSDHMAGVNYAFDISKSKYVCILDPDTVFVNEWVDDILPLLKEHAFVSNRFENLLNIARPQLMLFKREFWDKYDLRFEDYKDTGGNITLFCQDNNMPFFILENSYNDKCMTKLHVFPEIYCEQCFIKDIPFFLHQGRGASKGDRSIWFVILSKFLDGYYSNKDIEVLLENVLSRVKNKDEFKSTTSLKFKKDLAHFILKERVIPGDFLELGVNRGYTTAILGTVAKLINKKVYGFDNNQKLLDEAKDICLSNELSNCILEVKDIYKESWGLPKVFGLVFIDAMHEQKAFYSDMINAEKILLKEGYVVVHDYGLSNSHGKPIYDVLKENSSKYQIIKYIGEESGWNYLGTGETFDFEGAIVKIIS